LKELKEFIEKLGKEKNRVFNEIKNKDS